jgi:hypothetical protein
MTAPTEHDREALAGLLREALYSLGCGCGESGLCHRCDPLYYRIEAALSAQGGEETADTQHDRDMAWILAMGHALGLGSGFSVPIVPKAESFRKLFAEIREKEGE